MKISEVVAGIYHVDTGMVGWVVIADGSGAITLIDTGYPGERELLEKSLRQLGYQPNDIAAVLITHAHADDLGSARYLSDRCGMRILMHTAELAQARGEVQHQVAELDMARNAWRPGVLPWAIRALRAGGTKLAAVPAPAAIPASLDLPGRPIAVHTPGHTPGHTCYHLPDAGVVITGDTLVTAHPTSRRHGPQLLMPMFDQDRRNTLASLDVLARLSGDILIPGHGPTWHGPIADAAEQARAIS